MDLHLIEDQIDSLSLDELCSIYSSLADYTTAPVNIDEFLDSPEFLGPFFDGGLYPHWRKVLRDIYPNPYFSPYWLCVFRGAIGLGKSSIACAGLAYDLYRLLCMVNPQKSYNLVSSTKIVFALINRTLTLSGDVIWDKLSQIFVQSPFFTKVLGCLDSANKISRRRLKRDTLFPHRIDFIVGSRAGHALGQAVFGAVISEANFEVVEDQMYDTFNNLLRRMESRFMTVGGGIPGHIWLDSSESDKFSVVNRIVDSWKNSKGVYVSKEPIWNVKGHLRDASGSPIYSGKRFWVFCGSETRGPEIVEEGTKSLLSAYPDACMDVPVEHRDAFEADVNAAIRDLGGRATVSSSKLVRLRERLALASVVSPLFPDVIQLDFDDDTDQVFNHCKSSRYFADPLHKNIPRHIHVDIGLTGDRLGIAASLVVGFRDVEIRDPVTFEKTKENLPVLSTEWAFGVEPRPGKQIPLFKLRMFLQWLQQVGYPIAGVTLDGFQSADFIQGMTKMGFKAELLSVDKTVGPYVTLRTLIYEGRTTLPINAILKRELEELELSAKGDSVDHPRDGSKDLSDAVAGSTFKANEESGRARLFHLSTPDATPAQQVASMFWET
jgi:hypothetical protein